MRARTGRDRADGPRVLVVRTDRLGETLLNLPVLHALRAAWPHAVLIVMVRPPIDELLVGQEDVDEVVVEPSFRGAWWQRSWALSRLWRSWKIETILISNPKKEYHLAAWLAGIPIRVGYARKWGRLLTHRIPNNRARGERHEVEYNLELVRPLGVEVPVAPQLRLPTVDSDESTARRLLAPLERAGVDGVVAVHPWTSNPTKQWPLERFRLLMQRLVERPRVGVVLIGGHEEQRLASSAFGDSHPRVLNLIGQTSLGELAACLHQVRALVSNDSGPMHVAAAVGTPVVALFGTAQRGSDPRRWGPWGSGHTVIQRPLHEIAVDDVMNAVLPYLA